MKYLYLILIFLIATVSTHASHVMGSEIHYRSIGSGQYEITLKVYRDCNGIQVSQSNILATCGTTTLTLSNQTKVSQRDVTGIGAQCPTGSRCAGGSFQYGVEEHVWKTTVDLSPYSCCEWVLSWEQCCRNGNITTGQAAENFFVTAELNKCVGANSSPTFESLPIRMLCYNQNVTYNMGIQDTIDQGDSFSFALVPALMSLGTSTTYSGNFTPSRPLSFFGFPNQNLVFPAGFHLNQNSGDLTFRPVGLNQIAIIVIEVSEWRKDSTQVWQVIGKTRRDMQVIVINCINNAPPALSGPYAYEICAGDSVNIPLNTSDPDSGDSTYLSVLSNTLPWTIFTHNNGAVLNASGMIRGITHSSMISNQPYYITVKVQDDGCPLNAEIIRTIAVFVRDPNQFATFYAGPDRMMGSEDTITVFGVDSFSIGQQGYWKTLGDGFFIDSLARDAKYTLGQNDKQNCEIRLVRIPLTSSTCGSTDPDTMVIRRWVGDIEIRVDSASRYTGTVLLEGVSSQDSLYYQWWTTNGDGQFSDSMAMNTAYTFGSQDSMNCGAWIYLNSSTPSICSETKDSVWIGMRDLVQLDLTFSVNILAPDTIFLSLSGASPGTVYWFSAGTGTWQVDSINHTAMYFPSQADKTAGSVVLWADQPVFCGQNMDTDSVFVNLSLTGIQTPFANSLNLYPNPTEGKLHLGSSEIDRIQNVDIYDIHGKEIRLAPLFDGTVYTWDVSGFSRGMYILLVTDEQGMKQAMRFIVR